MLPFSASIHARKLLALWGMLFAFAILAACSSQTPESVAKNYIDAVAANRTEEAIGYYSLKDVKENDLTAVKGKLQMIVGQQYSSIQEHGGLDSVVTTLAKQDGNTARVDMELKFKNGKTKKDRLNLIQESGAWKIVLK
ncbi:MAG: DUF4878 domain-containing protein [Desulfobulbus sp.]|nr:DUF4878 domain-containing protein [Desulfobulbus sp.]